MFSLSSFFSFISCFHTFSKVKHLHALAFLVFLLNGCAQTPTPVSAPEIDLPLPPATDHLIESPLEAPPSLPQPPFKIALLLPLTGQDQLLGNTLLQAAELSLLENPSSSLEIFPGDTKSNETGALDALSFLLKENDIDLILGPLKADDVSAITPLAWEKAIPILSFSNTPSVAGDHVFIMGYAPAEQIKTIISYALSQGLRQFIALVPEGDYGKLVIQTLRQELSTHHGTLKEVLYDTGENFNTLVKELNLEGVDALVIPEGGIRLNTILAMLNENTSYQALKPRLLGSGQWDDETIYRHPLLQKAWFPGMMRSPQGDSFIKTYEEAYGQHPSRLAFLGYDGITIAGQVAHDLQNSVSQVLTRSEGFEGLEGHFSFTPQGHIIRGWSIFEISPEGPRLLTPTMA